ncbi:hypothetical protein BS78_09G098300 [Paspalum vaginatum]|nr:hypothetical protein BS78_09G098300 [Paspalum vaginatum]
MYARVMYIQSSPKEASALRSHVIPNLQHPSRCRRGPRRGARAGGWRGGMRGGRAHAAAIALGQPRGGAPPGQVANLVQRVLSLFRNVSPGSDLSHFQSAPIHMELLPRGRYLDYCCLINPVA